MVKNAKTKFHLKIIEKSNLILLKNADGVG